MPTRFNARGKTRYGQAPLPTGYDGLTSNFVIPSVGIEDVDVAMFKLFDKELPLHVSEQSDSTLKRVPIVFAGGEKWAMLKKNKPLRDKNGSLILPLITIVRQNHEQSPEKDVAGRGINQRTGEIVITRRLDRSDRNYQNLINRLLLNNQENLAEVEDGTVGQLTSTRRLGDMSDDGVIQGGGLLLADRKNNVVETIVVPSPQFITITYEVTVWTQYTHHMNQIIESILSSYLPQVQGWRLDTPKGYWFVAEVQEDAGGLETNFEDMSKSERTIKQKFTVKVPAYVFVAATPGAPVPIKRYVSAPEISFTIDSGELASSGETVEAPFLGSDDPTLPLFGDRVLIARRDGRRSGATLLHQSDKTHDESDPALPDRGRGNDLPRFKELLVKNSDGTVTKKYVRIVSINRSTGETSYASGVDFGALSIVSEE